MAKKEKNQEQLDLIDVKPENAKKILLVVKKYKKAQKARLEVLDEEKKQKQKALDLIREAKMVPLADGTIKFAIDNYKISVTPRDELIQIKEENYEDPAERAADTD